MSRPLGWSALLAATLAAVSFVLPVLPADPPPSPQKPTEHKEPKAVRRASSNELPFMLLPIEMDLHDVAPRHMKLKDALELARDRGTGGQVPGKAPIVVNEGAFKAAGGDAQDVPETEVKLPTGPNKVTLGNFLRLILAQVPERNATFVIRRGNIEITTYAEATLHALLAQPVAMRFDNRPLADAALELADYSGASIVLDARAGERLKAPVSATFLHDASVWSALYLLADMAGLRAVVIEDGIYVTTPERAEEFRKDQASRKDELRKDFLPNGPGGSMLLPTGSFPVGPQFRRPQQTYPPAENTDAAAAFRPPTW